MQYVDFDLKRYFRHKTSSKNWSRGAAGGKLNSTGSPRFGSGRFGSYRFRFIPVPVQKNSKKWKNIIFCVFQLRNGFWTLPGGPLDPLDQYKNPFIFYFLNFFHIFSLFRYKRPFNTINRCWDPSRMIENDLKFNSVLISYFFER